MTNREFFNAIASNNTIDTEIRDYATAAIAKLDAANEKRKNKPSKTQEANAPIVESILGVLSTEAHTATEIGAMVGVSTQKASALLRQLVAAGQASVTAVKVPKKGEQKGYTLPVDAE